MSHSQSSNLRLDHPIDCPEEPGCAAISVDVISSDPDVSMEPETEPDWETLSFPQTLSVDQIPIGETVDLLTSLERQNQTLRDRVAYLEGALESSQTTLRKELEHWEDLALSGDERIQEKDSAIAKHIEEITIAQEKITQLFQSLEQSHQTTQRQQILVETLNGQLHNSQERVAQLERECSVTQQRYVEQSQMAMQQEHQCRDLQARLYRQQRYTLQYKAALEKCLEVPQPIANSIVQQPATNIPTLLSETIHINNINVGKQINIPKSTPVQPWSAPVEEETNDLGQGAWLNSFLSDSEQFPSTEAISNFTWQSDIEPQTLSFDLTEEALQGLDAETLAMIDPRLVAWETSNLEGREAIAQFPQESASQSTGESVVPSPFITLQPMSEEDLEEAGEVPMRKRESLAAVDLPSFPKPTEPIVAATAAISQAAK